MKKNIVILNGQTLHEDSDYTWISGELAFNCQLSPRAPQAHDRVAVETYDEGVLIRRETFEVLKTGANEKMKWHRRTTDKFREKDC
jgi:hypothetical protein